MDVTESVEAAKAVSASDNPRPAKGPTKARRKRGAGMPALDLAHIEAEADHAIGLARVVRRTVLRGTPLDRLSGARIARADQWAARLAICRAVLGVGASEILGPKFRTGTNHPMFRPWAFLPDARPYPPCPECGAPGAEISAGRIGNGGLEGCPSCGAEWICGDYDWNSLGDCLRYVADAAAGLILDPDAQRCMACDDPMLDHIAAGRCDRAGCIHAPAPAGAEQLDLLGGPPVPEALTPAYVPPLFRDRPAGTMPAGLPNSDAQAASPACVSNHRRPVGSLRSGRHPTGTGV